MSAVPFASGWFAQWKQGGGTWFALHDRDGAPVTGAIPARIDGELLEGGDEDTPMAFLTWSDGAPDEFIELRVTLEWRRR